IFKPSLVNKFRLLLACIILFFILIIFLHKSPLEIFNTISPIQWIWFSLSGIMGLAIGDFFAFSAFSIIGPTKTSLLSTIAPAAALLGGIILLNEDINLIGYMGILVIIIAVIFIVKSKEQQITIEPKNELYAFGLFAGLMSAVAQGLGLVMTKIGFQPNNPISQHFETFLTVQNTNHNLDISPVHATFCRMLGGFVTIFIIDLIRQKDLVFIKPFFENKKGTVYLLIGTLFGPVLGVTCSIAAIQHMEVSLAQTIFALLPITVMFYGILFKKEKMATVAWISATIAILGVVLIIWRNDF
ncbi:MAG: DMT family transporter, partial [Bacteroidetes bacterium]|nr:DMT family transporter [Bacteroidota bacterium]